MGETFENSALGLLRELTDRADACFRDHQLETIRALVERRQRALLVQRTGWGKSAVYFVATRLLRERGAGPTILFSPLLALMRDQIAAAARLGLVAETINSTNTERWAEVQEALEADQIDVLLLSPQRLGNASFRSEVLPVAARHSGLLVVDEAHCISDWGHDFVPDYRRIARVLDHLPQDVPVLCCTATANDRVMTDLVGQIGHDIVVFRGTLEREGLRLHVLELPEQSRRLAWLAAYIPRLAGSGIVYCLTVRDTERVASWLCSQGIDVACYHGDLADEERLAIERRLLDNDLKAVVATSALGMGYDKPDLGFVVHYQSPGSPVAYYQQVGRAGRQIPESYGVLLRGREDPGIQDWFIKTAFASRADTERVLATLTEAGDFVRLAELENVVNIRRSRLQNLLKQLEVEGVVQADRLTFRRTAKAWTYDEQRIQGISDLRRMEQRAMVEYATSGTCRMAFLRHQLDDDDATRCGWCDICTGEHLSSDVATVLVEQAVQHLRHRPIRFAPRKQWPDRTKIPPAQRVEVGMSLSEWGDGGWGSLVEAGKRSGHFEDGLVRAGAELIRQWVPRPPPHWVTFVPSLRHPQLVAAFAARLGNTLGLPVHDVIQKVRHTRSQKHMQNSTRQHANVSGVFEISQPVPGSACLLVDDIVDSQWTFTVVGGALRDAGCEAVHPFALAMSTAT
jgi:ATP-dependent DNA helicase RecQ